MSEIDVLAVIRAVCDESDAADPAILAKEVVRRIPRSQAMAALQQVLPVVIQHSVSRRRTIPTALPVVGSTPSHKVAAIRESWRRALRQRIAVAEGEWKFLADCTAADLRFAASINEQHAIANARRAEQKRKLADLLDEHGAETVAELPQDALASAFEDAA